MFGHVCAMCRRVCSPRLHAARSVCAGAHGPARSPLLSPLSTPLPTPCLPQHKEANPAAKPPKPNPLLLGLTPSQHVLQALERVRAAEVSAHGVAGVAGCAWQQGGGGSGNMLRLLWERLVSALWCGGLDERPVSGSHARSHWW